MKRFLLPVAFGFAGMFIAHFVLFILAFGLRINFMPYVIAYPIVYGILAFLLARNNPASWLSNVICIMIIPFVYWYVLLWSDGKLHWTNGINFNDSAGMPFILPVTFLIAFFISLFVYRNKAVYKSSPADSASIGRNTYHIYMNGKAALFLKPFLIGAAALIVSFIVMMGTTPLVTSLVTAILYFLLGIWMGRVQPKSLRYAPLLMNILIWIVFIPMGMDIWPPKIHIWYFLIPPLISLPAAYFGMYIGAAYY